MRILVSFFAAICMSIALFYLMRYMISSEGRHVAKPPPGTTVSLVRMEKTHAEPAGTAPAAPLAPRPSNLSAESLPPITEPVSAQPPPEPPALHAALPELEPIVPNGRPYLGRYVKPTAKAPAAVPKPVPPRKKAAKSPSHRRKAATDHKEKIAHAPSTSGLGPRSPTGVVGSDSGSGAATGPTSSGGAGGAPGLEDEVVALFKLSPKYPRKAARAGKEGWVKLEFTITRDGNVTDAAVVDARPRRLFDRAALRAIRKWRFKPKIKSGKPVARRATQVIEFKLTKN